MDKITTGIKQLDYAFEGGIPFDKICEMVGRIDFNNLPIQRFEKLGDTVYPVTYFPENGITIVDYPERPFLK